MSDKEFTTPENPISAIFSKIMGMGSAPSTFMERLKILDPANSHFKPGASEPLHNVLQSRDKYNIVANSSSFTHKVKVLSGESSWEALKHNLVSRHGDGLGKVLSLLENVSMRQSSIDFIGSGSQAGHVLYSSSRNALFFGTPEAGFSPILLREKSGNVNIGFRTFGAVGLARGDKQADFIDAYYSSLASVLEKGNQGRGFSTLAATDTLSKFRKLTNYGNPLGSLLRGSVISRGFNVASNRSFFALQSSLIGDSGILNLAHGAHTASAVINIITRTGFYPRDLSKGLGLPDSATSTEAFDRALELTQNYPSQLTAAFNQAGMTQYIPLIKPDYLINPNNFQVPNVARMKEFFGNIKFPKHIAEKGAFQFRHIRKPTRHQIAEFGESVLPGFYYPGEAAKGPHGLSLNVGVLQTKNALYDRVLFQEGGALITDQGARKLSSQLPAGYFDVKLPNAGRNIPLEKALGVDLPGDRGQLNKAFDFTLKEFNRAVSSSRRVKYEDLSDKEQHLRRAFRSTSKKYHGVIRQALKENLKIKAYSRTSSGVRFSLATGPVARDGSVEMITGLRRFTGIYGHELTEAMKASGLDLVVSADEFQKMFHGEILLNQLIKVAEKNGELSSIESRLGISNVHGKRVIEDQIAAQEEAIKIVNSWSHHSEKKFIKLAALVNEGADVLNSIDSNLISKYGVVGLRAFAMRGGLRADHAEDINALAPLRITPSKLNIMASRSRMFGYKSIDEDPVLSLFHKRWLKQTKGSFALDFATGIVNTTEDSTISQMFNVLTRGQTPTGNVYSVGNKKFISSSGVGHSIPHPDEFRHAKGGVHRSKLKDTIFSGDITYIDLGKIHTLRLRDAKGNVLNNSPEFKTRYLPVPNQLIRMGMGVEQTEFGSTQVIKGPSSRIVSNTLNQNFITSFFDIQEGFVNGVLGFPDEGGLRDYERGLTKMMYSLGRQANDTRGVLENLATLTERSGFRGRLEMTSGANQLTAGSFLDINKVFEANIYEDEFLDLLERTQNPRLKGLKQKYYTAKGQLRSEAFTYGLLTVDPTQRAEHQLLVRTKLLKGRRPGSTMTGKVGIQLNPLVFLMTERDVDRDVGSLFMVEAMGGDRRALRKQYEKQMKMAEPLLWMHKAELERQVVGNDKTLSQLVAEGNQYEAEAALRAYISQKKEAHAGYRITRTVDRMLPLIETSDELAVSALVREGKHNYASPYIKYAREKYNPMRAAIAESLAQEFKQGGVQKGMTSPLDQLSRDLHQIRLDAKNITPEEAVARATGLFDEFLKTGKKARAYLTSPYLLEEMYGKEAVPKLLDDLKRGTVESLEVAANIRKGAAKLLGERYGLGYALSAFVKEPKSAITIMQDRLRGLKDNASKVMSHVINPILGIGKGFDPTSESISSIAPTVSTKAERLQQVLQKFEGWKGIAAGGIIGAGLMAIADEGEYMAPLPPEVIGNQPTDAMPYLSPYVGNPTAKLYTSINSYPETKVSYDRRRMETFDTQSFIASSNSSYEIRETNDTQDRSFLDRQLRSIANSSFVY